MAGMVPKDVYELTGVADPRLSPDGSTVAYVVGAVDEKDNEYKASIWLAAPDGSQAPRRFTSGEKADADPRWSPDGSQLAFTSNRADKASQLYVMPVAGGEPRKLTSLKEDVSQAVWSPDGTRIAFVARVRDAAYDEEDDKKRTPRRLTRLQYKLDSVGWTADRRQHLFVVPADGSAEPVQLTDGDCEDHSPAWSPDGGTIAFVSARHDDWDLEMVNDVYLVDAAGGEPRRLTHGGGSVGSVSWAPDGTRLAVDRYEGVYDDPRHSQIALVGLEDGDFTFLTRSLDLNCTTYPGMREPLWDGDGLVFVVEDHGRVHVYRVAADGSDGPRVVAGGERVVTGLDVAAGRLVFTASEPARLSELYDGGPASGSDDPASAGRRLTSVGEAFDLQPLHVADRRRALPGLAERHEVVQAEQSGTGGGHPLDVEFAADRGGGVPQQGVGRAVGQPVGVPPPDRGEPGVEPLGGDGDPVHDDIVRECPAQPAGQGAGDLVRPGQVEVDVRHLAAGVHAGVRPSGTDQDGRLGQPQHPAQPGLQLALDRAQAGLGGPAVERRPVVADVEAVSHARRYARSWIVRPASTPRRSYLVTGRSS